MARKSIDVKVRPLSNPSLEKASLLGAARLYVSKDSLIALTGGLDNGKACLVELLGDSDDGADKLRQEGLLWALADKNVSPNVVMMSRAFQKASGFKIGDQVRIAPTEAGPPDADVVVVRDLGEGSKEDGPAMDNVPVWEYSVSLSLKWAEHVFPGMVFEGVSINKLRRDFKVVSVNSQTRNVARFDPDSSSSVRILRAGDDDDPGQDDPSQVQTGGDLVVKGIPGLGAQVKIINEFLWTFSGPFWMPNECQSCGFMIHGGRGTGKTFILQHIADTNWGRVHWISSSDKLTTIKEIFKQARTQQPTVILIDDLEELIVQDRTNRDAIIKTMCDEMDALSAIARSHNALPKVAIVATCSDYMTDVPYKLQQRTRFYNNVALPIPRAPERLDILRYYDPPLPRDDKDACLVDIAAKTHAYNPKDLASLVMNAVKIRANLLRYAALGSSEPVGEQILTREDMEHAWRVTRPTAMRDINLQPPTIHWQDVGGQDNVKKELSRMIKYAKDPDPTVPRILKNPPKGLLLYGPPGCSKTLSAQAMATESSFNFFSVKAAELLNMYVGESERAVRNLFERARAASPSIIFFDEIDSIGGQRPSGPGASAGRGGGAGSVNTVTTLLTEMDGFESLTGVLVIAATNRPEAIDPALLRAGRFDKVVYVGPPDLTAREAVFGVHLRGTPLAPDVDLAELAARAEGYSGAEIHHICTEAMKTVQDRLDDDETGTVKPEIAMADLIDALEREPKAITQQMIDGYARWARQFRKT